ncbi:hypothetical protein GCM10023147_35340 [Tsukamurella soli]|uniref:DUF1003 domain-containing protein n=1 Tax=Tsukamurella soli TaxID=644556 RepID=A0ABP8K0Z2_9ACTN
MIQTVIVVVWVALNVTWVALRFDPYPFILLNLAFSTQAAYAAPLILLAQNRQESRDRVSLDEDRTRAAQTKADTEFLARELASVRLAVGDGVSRDYLRRELDEIHEKLDALVSALGQQGIAPAGPGSGSGKGKKKGKAARATLESLAARDQGADTAGTVADGGVGADGADGSTGADAVEV